MVSCIILVGPKRWCENHKKVIQDNGESWLLYDKLPINEIDINHFRLFVRGGDFITCICIPKQSGGNRDIEYIAYSPKKTDKNVIEMPHLEREYYFDEELINNYPGINPTVKKGFDIPIKPPGPCPPWEDYDFINMKVKDKIERLPRPYNVAIKITSIQTLEVPLNEFRNLKNDGPINEGQLQKSFIIARTNNLSVENFRKNIRKEFV